MKSANKWSYEQLCQKSSKLQAVRWSHFQPTVFRSNLELPSQPVDVCTNNWRICALWQFYSRADYVNLFPFEFWSPEQRDAGWWNYHLSWQVSLFHNQSKHALSCSILQTRSVCSLSLGIWEERKTPLYPRRSWTSLMICTSPCLTTLSTPHTTHTSQVKGSRRAYKMAHTKV